MASSYKGLTTKELTTRLIAADKENAKLAFLLKTIEPELVTANDKLDGLHSECNSLKAKLEEANTTISSNNSVSEIRRIGELKALTQRDNICKELEASLKRNDILLRDLEYEKKRRISAENKAFELETRLHNTVVSEYPASDVPSYMVGLRIDRNGKIA